MHCVRELNKDYVYVGASDHRIKLFENVYALTEGVSYNSYLLKDDKTVLFDTVDLAVGGLFFENLSYALAGRHLDYVVVHHMEPDHAATLGELLLRYPNIKVIGNQMTFKMMKQFFDFDVDAHAMIVKEGDTLETGHHQLSFVFAPMVHWPEVMVTYDATDKILFSADAFGSFGAIQGNLFSSERDLNYLFMDEFRRYYTNICGKYGTQVNTLLKKAEKLDIKIIASLHGVIFDDHIKEVIECYHKWANYEPEEKGVMIAYGSIYGGTENAANILANELAKLGVRNIRVFDTSTIDASTILAESFRYSHLVFACSSYNAGLFTSMQNALIEIQEHQLQNRTIALIENGTWAPSAKNTMKKLLSGLKGMTYIDPEITIKSRLKSDEELVQLAQAIFADMNKKEVMPEEAKPLRKWKCKVCGYVYEGDELPDTFVCPLCKQPASSFEEITE